MILEKASFWTEKDLKKIIDENLTEYSTLEFKSLAALNRDNKEEISKDIASFANAAGGVIIYGIKEVKEGTSIKLLLEDGLDINEPYKSR
jgi:predicted HTH transcriptional regulator